VQNDSEDRSQEAANRALISNIYSATARGDVQPLFDAMAPDFTAYENASLPWGGVYKGVEENGRLVEQLAKYLDFSQLRMHHFAVDCDLVIAYGSVVWRGEDGDQSLTVPLAECYVIRNGKIVSIHPFFWDTASFVEGNSRK
jgi:ketosteroid isomerase-like protein